MCSSLTSLEIALGRYYHSIDFTHLLINAPPTLKEFKLCGEEVHGESEYEAETLIQASALRKIESISLPNSTCTPELAKALSMSTLQNVTFLPPRPPSYSNLLLLLQPSLFFPTRFKTLTLSPPIAFTYAGNRYGMSYVKNMAKESEYVSGAVVPRWDPGWSIEQARHILQVVEGAGTKMGKEWKEAIEIAHKCDEADRIGGTYARYAGRSGAMRANIPAGRGEIERMLSTQIIRTRRPKKGLLIYQSAHLSSIYIVARPSRSQITLSSANPKMISRYKPGSKIHQSTSQLPHSP